MGVILYNFFQWLYVSFAGIYALFNKKAAKWVAGRKEWETNILTSLKPGERRIWVHCSSVGEFEQAKPVIAALSAQYPVYKIVVTFFSPSGYEASRNNTLADHIFYLPTDTKHNADTFIELINPALAIFIKYEFWYHYLQQLKIKNVPILLVSGVFRPGQAFFKWYGSFFRSMLGSFRYFFLQDEASLQLLGSIGIMDNCVVAGDTRYDRVAAIASQAAPIDAIDQFKGDKKMLIAGSTWPADEDVISAHISALPASWKLIIAPHEIDDAHVHKVQQLFGSDAVLYSELSATNTGSDKKVLIINNIGMLSRLFAYADVAFIGGGFDKGGIHNILEPAVFGVPVIFGPVYQKYVEAKALAAMQLVFPVSDAAAYKTVLSKLVADEQYRSSVSAALKRFMQEQTGATDVILKKIAEERWLVTTNQR